MAKTKLREPVKQQRSTVEEHLQLWGSFPECTAKHSCELDWVHVLLINITDAVEHVRLLDTPGRSDREERRLLRNKLARIIATCEAWDKQL